MNVSKILEELRNKYGYTQIEVANKLGITRQTYTKMEKGETSISVDQLETLANYYGVPIEEFYYGIENIEKFKQMYMYILSKFKNKGVPKTKLAKLLYLADFRHFYENLESMSGMLYRCETYGPLANNFSDLTDELHSNGEIRIELLSGGANMVSIKSVAYNNNYDLLSNQEKKELDEICELWKDIRTEEIVNYTHSQKPWMACRKNEIIPYTLILQEDPEHVYKPVA